MFEKKDISLMTYIALPVVLFLGWVIYVSWLLGIEGRWILILILISIFYFSIDFIKKSKVRQEDIRWLVAPFLIIILSKYLPWWDYTQSWNDASFHIIQSMNFVGISDWIPPLGMSYRSPIVPGVLSFEFLFGEQTNQIFTIPILLFILTSWQIQHFSEMFSSKITAIVCVCFFILLPTVRYWGQMAMTDIPSTGMWFFCMSLFIHSEQNLSQNRFIILLGACIGLLFLTKYTFIYFLHVVFATR